MYNIVELFSGIGSQLKALKNIDMAIHNAYTCEWDVHALTAYDAIHNSPDMPFDVLKIGKPELLERMREYSLSNSGKESMDYDILRTYSVSVLRRIYTAIERSNNFIDITNLTGDRIPEDIDLLTYSFPCQDLSNVGALHGYTKGIDKDSGSRSSLLWQVGRILSEMRVSGKQLPRFLLMENVPTLLSKRHSGNFNIWKRDLEELGYVNYHVELNASNFGLPQNRPRLLMISVYVGDDAELRAQVDAYFFFVNADTIEADYKASPYFHQYEIGDLLRIDYSDPKLFQEACECTPNDTPSRRDIWKENPQLVLRGNKINPAYSVIRTITTKQDRNPNSGNLYFESGIAGRGTFRYLTPRECFLFMGFTDEDYERVIKYNPEIHKDNALFTRDKLIRMAGNSIPVKLLEGIFLQIKKIDETIFGNNGCT